MERTDNGDVLFEKDGRKFFFRSDNCKEHCLKHPKIRHDRHLLEVEAAIFDPDVIVQPPANGRYIWSKKAHCKVQSYQNLRRGILVRTWKVVLFLNKSGGIVATAYEVNALNYQLIHPLEKIIWKKPNSLI